jgi:thioredoxin 2
MSYTFAVCDRCEKVNRVSVGRSEAETPICGNCKAALPIQHGVVSLSGTSLQHLIDRSPIPIVVDFWAPNCVPCRAFEPEFERAAAFYSGKIVFGRLNSAEHFLAAGLYGIRSVPTLILFEAGVEKERKFGAISSQQLMTWLGFEQKAAA